MAVSTREKIIRCADSLFYRDGFHAVGLDRILAEAGVTKTTFYNHFESKEDLVVQTMRWHDAWWRETFRAMLRRAAGDSPRDQLLAIFDALESYLASDEYNGCFFINAAVEFPLPHDPAHQLAAEHKRSMEAVLRELGALAGADDPAALARELSLLMEGAYVTRQIGGDASITKVAASLAAAAIERRIPPARS